MVGYIPVIIGAPDDRPDEVDARENGETVARVLEDLGYRSDVLELGLDLTPLERLTARRPDAVFNLVETICGDGRLGFLACAVLDHFKTPYTGAPTSAYILSSSKLLTKSVLAASGVSTPEWWSNAAPKGRRVIVKSVWEHASLGIDQQSVVDGADAADEIARREAVFGGQFFAETYVEGREFNISVLERGGTPVVLPMAEMAFDALPPGTLPIVDYDAKWTQSAASYRALERRFGVEASDPDLAQKLEVVALSCWRAAGLRGYARIDVRIDEAGLPLVLEFNANPCLDPQAGFAAAVAAAGLTYADAILNIVDAGRSAGASRCFASAL